MLIAELKEITEKARKSKFHEEMKVYQEIVLLCKDAASKGHNGFNYCSPELPSSVVGKLKEEGLRVTEDRTTTEFHGYIIGW